jgi:hypothetical protein
MRYLLYFSEIIIISRIGMAAEEGA